MPGRKAIEMGKGTILVSLPKDWVRRNGVKKGADLSVEELSAGKLLVRPYREEEEEQKQIRIDYPGADLGEVLNGVTGAYLLGYDVIDVVGKKPIPREAKTRLKGALGRLVGLEVMDEDSKSISLQFLLKPTAVVPEGIVRRMAGILDGMLKDAAEALSKRDFGLLGMVGERDDEVDRLYFLLVRVTRAAIVRPDVAEGYGLSAVDLLDYRVLASFLESIGDAVTGFSQSMLGEMPAKEAAKVYSGCVLKLRGMNTLATKAFISRRAHPRTISRDVEAGAREVREKLASAAREYPAGGARTAEALGALERISSLIVDISDLALTTKQTS